MDVRIVDITDDGTPLFDVAPSEIWASCVPGGVLRVLSPAEAHSARQRRWYRGVCLKGLSDWNGDTIGEWDYRLKVMCGSDILPAETIYIGEGQVAARLTIQGASKKRLTAYIEAILSAAITHGWPVTPPDPELRSDK